MKDKVTRDNRKALPKFLLMIVAAALVGGIVGFFSAMAADGFSGEALQARVDAFLTALVPWGLLVCAAVLLVPAAVVLGRAKAAFGAWDGEDEDTGLRVEERLNVVLLLTVLALIVGLFFLSAGVLYTAESWRMLANAALFIVVMAAVTILQQKVVDLTRRMNPEKEGSVYDAKFRKKWFESCDEAERAQIGQASYRAYQTTSGVCMIVWLVLLLASLFYPTGILPTVAVLVVYGVLQVRYLAECIRMNRRQKT